jgi:hypothetical protein
VRRPAASALSARHAEHRSATWPGAWTRVGVTALWTTGILPSLRASISAPSSSRYRA